MIVSCKAKKKQAICDERVSITAVKLANALNKPPCESYCLFINNSTRSNHIESANQQWRKLVPPIQSTYIYIQAIVSLMAPVHAPMLEKPSPCIGTNSLIY